MHAKKRILNAALTSSFIDITSRKTKLKWKWLQEITRKIQEKNKIRDDRKYNYMEKRENPRE